MKFNSSVSSDGPSSSSSVSGYKKKFDPSHSDFSKGGERKGLSFINWFLLILSSLAVVGFMSKGPRNLMLRTVLTKNVSSKHNNGRLKRGGDIGLNLNCPPGSISNDDGCGSYIKSKDDRDEEKQVSSFFPLTIIA